MKCLLPDHQKGWIPGLSIDAVSGVELRIIFLYCLIFLLTSNTEPVIFASSMANRYSKIKTTALEPEAWQKALYYFLLPSPVSSHGRGEQK